MRLERETARGNACVDPLVAPLAKQTNRAASEHGSRRDVGHARRVKALRRRSTLKRVHENLLLDAHHLPGWQDGG
ncbi:MAG TPA: hypothetical protein VMJ11_01515 [Paraburkholderia sp.]|uniref:hypothetical protein n=1 Tax=Paraburkholderia sp. TaxID=1926495 RepID=UPI002C13C609|nr:hypothetical protein [Paraburkholderia sp.]HTR05348.1 hypothetical protein [Paraburkholderia sp.]